MKLCLIAAFCALLAAEVTASKIRDRTVRSIPLPPDHLKIDTTNLSNHEHVKSLHERWAHKHGKHHLINDTKAMKNVHAAAHIVQRNRAAVATGSAGAVLALNHFAHISPAEFRRTRLGRKPIDGRTAANTVRVPPSPRHKRDGQKPSVNYTALGYVTPVKNQGVCNSCWTFSAAGAIEGAYFRAKKQLIGFSAQEYVDCVTESPNCDGGIEDFAFNYTQLMGGILPDASYPYVAQGGNYSSKCQNKSGSSRIPMNLIWNYLDNDDTTLMDALLAFGPLSVAIATSDALQFYSTGIVDSTVLCGTNIDHAVLLTGAGTDAKTGKDYWIVKNSWGDDWGERGYFRVDRATPYACGLSNQSYVVMVTGYKASGALHPVSL